MTIMQERLTTALENKKNDINSYIWKGHKVLDNSGRYVQSETRLIDMKDMELQKCYNHCKTMLYNKDYQNPGRYVVLEIIADQKERCGIELFLRTVEQKNKLSRFSLIESINKFLANNKDILKNTRPTMEIVFSSISPEFKNLSVDLIIDGCLDKLGTFSKKHITRTFILKQGIWLTPAESKDLIEHDEDGLVIDRLTVIRERLNIKEVEKLYLNSKGLNYTQMRAMLNIKPNKKYSDLTTVQLETLRNRILFNLEDSVKNHIKSWEGRMEEIERVSEHNEIRLS